MDQEQIHQVISKFMEDVMQAMLEFDVTIDKFLGDGVLGFSNNPVAHEDYIERVVDAAFAIRNRIEQHQEFYNKYWQGEFSVRIGIAAGEADVGFYGIEQAFRSYTAIGPVINLASRLSGIGENNQVHVCEAVKKSLTCDQFYFNRVVAGLKGFEKDLPSIFAVEKPKCFQSCTLPKAG